MDLDVPQSTTLRVPLKAFLASDHVTQATGKTIAVTISKNMGAFANPSAGATNATELANGWYYVDLSTTDMDTLGTLIIRGTEGTIDNTEKAYRVVKATNGGWTALPDAAAQAAGGLFTRGTGAGQINQAANGQIDINAVTWGGTAVGSAYIRSDVLRVAGVDTPYYSGTVDVGSGSTWVILDATKNDDPTNSYIWVKHGDGTSERRLCYLYNNTTKRADVTRPWTTTPASGEGYITGGFSHTLAETSAATSTQVLTDFDAIGIDASWVAIVSTLTTTNLTDALTNYGASTLTAAQVWASGTRTLTSGANIALAKGTGVTGFNDILATDVWAAVTRTLTSGANIALAKGTGVTGFNDLSAANVNAEVLDVLATDTPIDGKSFVAALRYIAAILAGEASGAGSGNEEFLGLDGATRRVSVTVDEDGNRTGVVYD